MSCIAGSAAAQGLPPIKSGPATIDCVLEAATRQNVPANVLLAIGSIERGKNGQYVRNTNGTYDLGHFQINSMHFKPRGLFHNHPQITPELVAQHGCYNAELAAWMVRRAIEYSKKDNFWNRVADYHSATPKFNRIYTKKLIAYSRDWADWLAHNYPQRVVVAQQ